MNPFSWAGLGANVIELFGKPKLVRKLYEIMMGGRRTSRATSLSSAADVVRKVSEARAIDVETLTKLRDLMEAAGYTDEEIRVVMRDHLSLEGPARALETILHYLESGKVESVTMYKRPDVGSLGVTFRIEGPDRSADES